MNITRVNITRGGLAQFLGAAAIAQSSHGAAPEPRSPLRRNLQARRDAEFATVQDTFGPLHAFDAWHLVFLVHQFL